MTEPTNQHLYPPITKKALLQKAAENEGLTVDELLDRYILDGSVPGACTVCGTINDQCEPDMEDGMCEECDNNTVQSVLVLAEVI